LFIVALGLGLLYFMSGDESSTSGDDVAGETESEGATDDADEAL